MTNLDALYIVVSLLICAVGVLFRQVSVDRKELEKLDEIIYGDGYYNGKVGLQASVADLKNNYRKVLSSVEELYERLIPELTTKHKKDIELYMKVKLSYYKIGEWSIDYREGTFRVFFKTTNDRYRPIINMKLSTLLREVAELKDLKDKLCCKKDKK